MRETTESKVIKTQGEWAVVTRTLAQNKGLTYAARGMMLYLLSKPDGWTMRFHDLLEQSPAGRTHVRSVVKELIEAGYCRRRRFKAENGMWRTINEFYDMPQAVQQHLSEVTEQPAATAKADRRTRSKPVEDDEPGEVAPLAILRRPGRAHLVALTESGGIPKEAA